MRQTLASGSVPLGQYRFPMPEDPKLIGSKEDMEMARTGTVAILAYAAANIPMAIFHGWSWKSTWVSVLDGIVYGLFTAGVFGWLWP